MTTEGSIDAGANHELVVIEGPVFVIRLRNTPHGHDVHRALDALYTSPRHRDPFAIVWVVTPELTGYDRSLLEVYRNDRQRSSLPRFMAVVMRNPLHKMVASAVAVGLRTAMRLPLTIYDDEPTAIAAARTALAR